MGSESILQQLRSGQTTFLGLPLLLEPTPVPGVVLGAPFDGAVLNRPGARMGPWALREASLGVGRMVMPLRLQVPLRRRSEEAAQGWVDGGNLPTLPFSQEDALSAVEVGVGAWIDQGARSFLLGGDHLMTLGALRAHAQRFGPLGLLLLDAHPDAARGNAWGAAQHHGTWLRMAIQKRWLDPTRTVVVGLRAPRLDPGELSFLEGKGVRLWTPWDVRDFRQASLLRGDLARIGQGPAYVSVDLDVLDPAHCPAVAEPVPAGLTPAEAIGILDQIHEWPHSWVGADLMELAPVLPGGDDSARTGLHLALHILAAGHRAGTPETLQLVSSLEEEE